MHSLLRRRAEATDRRIGYIPPPEGMHSDLASLSAKLPQIGSRLTNKHGIKWTVHDHVRASNIATKPGDESELTCYPVIFPENLSERFEEFLAEVARCTPKIILPLDTMPSVFPNRSHVAGHSIDAWSHPEAIHIFIDAEDCSEVVLAHELAHAWIDFVKGIEDHRVWKDREDTGRYTQVQLMQSFVLDFAVHKCLEEEGFDQTQIRADWEVASMQLRVAAEHGYRPVNPREAIYMASHLAAVLVEESVSTLPVPLANSLPIVKRNLPEIFAKASGLAEAVSDSFPSDRESALKAIGSVLEQSFAFTDPNLDYSADLLYVEPEVDWEMDKAPDWLRGQPVRAKCEIGVAMARLGATSADTPVLRRKNNFLEISFTRPDGSTTEYVPLKNAVIPPGPGEEVIRANERIEEMRQAKKRLEEMRKLTERKQMPNVPPRPQAPRQSHPFGPHGPDLPGFGPRSYSPGMARWLTKVRMEEMLAGEHPYSYAYNNPTTYIDPDGLLPLVLLPILLKPTPPNVFCTCDPVRVHSVKKRKGKDDRYNCYFSACADYCTALDNAAKDARATCEEGGILGAPGYNNSLPVCNAESEYWQECGVRITVPGGLAFNDAYANHSNYPYYKYQIAIAAPYCLVECTMRLCCATLQATDPKSTLKNALKRCRKKYG